MTRLVGCVLYVLWLRVDSRRLRFFTVWTCDSKSSPRHRWPFTVQMWLLCWSHLKLGPLHDGSE